MLNIFNTININKFSSYCKKNQKTIARWFFATNHKDVGSLYPTLLTLTVFKVFLVLIITIILKINSFFVLCFFFKNIYNFDLIFYIILLDFLIVYFIFIYIYLYLFIFLIFSKIQKKIILMNLNLFVLL